LRLKHLDDQGIMREVCVMKHRSASLAYSLVEVLITVAIIGLLLVAVGNAVAHVLGVELLGSTRQSALRSADELAARLAEEARSSTAVFVPTVDVLGQPNSGTGAHEVDFYRKTSENGSAFVAYRFDAPSDTVTRYEYVAGAGGATISNSDLMAQGVQSMTAMRIEPSSVASVVGAASVRSVDVYYGSPQLVGGNGIVDVSIVAGSSGEQSQHLDIHLSSRAAPTNIAVLVPSGTPPASPSSSSSPIVVSFILRSRLQLPHGPNHQGDPGSGSANGGIHGPGLPGTAEFIGNGTGATIDWLALYSAFDTVSDGTYGFKNSVGDDESVTISCGSQPCPPFVPMPVPTSGTTITFHTLQ
jgi:hypothetical protein